MNRSETVKNYAVAVAAFSVAIAAGMVAHRVGKIDTERLSREIADSFSEVRPQLVETLRQSKIAAFELQATAKALKQEATDPEAIRERQRLVRSGNVIAGEVTAGLVQFNERTLPALTLTANSAQALIDHTDSQLNRILLPSIKAAVEKSSEPLDALTNAINILAADGSIALQDAHAILSDPELNEIVENLNAASAEFVLSSRNITETTGHLAAAAHSTADIAALIKRYGQETSKWRKAIIVAQLLSALTPIGLVIK